MRVKVRCLCCNVVDIQPWLYWYNVCVCQNKKKCSRNKISNKCKKQIPQESLSKSFLNIIFTHFETPALLMVFTLIVPFSMMIREYPNALHLFLTSKRNFLLSNESDSFKNVEFSLLNPRSFVFFPAGYIC